MHKNVNNLIDIQKKIHSKKLPYAIDPKIIAVSKTFNMNDILPLIEYGHIHFGENKVQEAADKWPVIKNKFKKIKLHMIGKLQTNKVKNAINLFDYIHSLDSLKLAKKISDEQKKNNKNIKLFIQINIGNENQKSGILIEELENFYSVCTRDLNLDIIGLMCLPPINEEPTKYFKKMKLLSENISLNNLSMGMSSDYMIALDNGANFLRIGSQIFGARN